MIHHRGHVRGGCNRYARFFLCILPPSASSEEAEEILDRWSREFGFIAGSTVTYNEAYTYFLDGSNAIVFHINTRAEFTRAIAMIRKAASIEWDVACTLWDIKETETNLGLVRLSDRPAVFWRELALAQAFYRE